jgi:integrase
MGRKGTGVEVRESSLRLRFTFEGKRQIQTLMLNGEPMLPTAANVKYAQRLAIEIKEKIRHLTFSMAEYFPASGSGGTLTVAVQLDTWLAAQRIEESTRAGYSSGVKFWKETICGKNGTPLGDKALRGLRTSHVLTALATRPELSGKTINNYVQVLREAVELAVTDKLLTENPVAKVPTAKHQKPPPDPFSRDEMEKILADLNIKHAGQIPNFVEFWFWSGLRTSEIFGLRWENVDLNSGSVLVTEAVVRGIHKDHTKTHVVRTVKLNSRALRAIQQQRQHTQVAGNLVFQDPRYLTPWLDERAFRRSYWTPTLKRLGIRYRRPYNMRHTYATVMLMAGMNSAFCAKQLGHSVEMFHKTYSRWLDGAQNDLEMQRLENSIGPALALETNQAPVSA